MPWKNRSSRRNNIRHKGFWLGLVVSCLGLAVALKGVHFKDLGVEMSQVPWAAALGLGFLSVLGTAMRSYRWKIAIESFSPVSLKNVFSAFMIGIFGLNVIPARVGELLRVVVLAKNSSLSNSAILATVVFERIVDGLVLITLFCVGLWFYPAADAHSLFGAGQTPYLLALPPVFFGCFVLLILFSRRPEKWKGPLARMFGRFGKFGDRVPGMLDRFAGGLVIFSDKGRLFRYFAWSFAAWVMYGVYFQLNFKILGIPLGLGEGLVVLTATAVGAMIPAAPGFVGTYHAFCKTALTAFGVSEARALTFAVVTHLAPYLLNTLIGFACSIRENIHLSDLSKPPTVP